LQDGIVAGDVYKELLEAGLIVNAVNATTLRFAPPLTVSDAEIDEAVAMVKEVLK
jgi:4-aminobutyrate aminotransferase-like enzyme